MRQSSGLLCTEKYQKWNSLLLIIIVMCYDYREYRQQSRSIAVHRMEQEIHDSFIIIIQYGAYRLDPRA